MCFLFRHLSVFFQSFRSPFRIISGLFCFIWVLFYFSCSKAYVSRRSAACEIDKELNNCYVLRLTRSLHPMILLFKIKNMNLPTIRCYPVATILVCYSFGENKNTGASFRNVVWTDFAKVGHAVCVGGWWSEPLFSRSTASLQCMHSALIGTICWELVEPIVELHLRMLPPLHLTDVS